MRKMMHGFRVALVLMILSPAAAGQDPQDFVPFTQSPSKERGFVDLFNAATKFYEARDYPAMQQSLRAALTLRPAHPTATYKLASALSLSRQADAALDVLESLAGMGLSFDISKDGDFASLRGRPRFTELMARFARNREPVGKATEAFRVFSAALHSRGPGL